MNRQTALNIFADTSGFYPESLRLLAKKFLAKHGTADDKKLLQRSPQKQTARLGDSKVLRIGEYNENNNDSNPLSSIL